MLQHVLDAIRLVYERGFWLEIVTLVVPGFNDDEAQLRAAAEYIASVSPEIPWHVTAFHQDYKMTDAANTSAATLERACEIGAQAGLQLRVRRQSPRPGGPLGAHLVSRLRGPPDRAVRLHDPAAAGGRRRQLSVLRAPHSGDLVLAARCCCCCRAGRAAAAFDPVVRGWHPPRRLSRRRARRRHRRFRAGAQGLRPPHLVRAERLGRSRQHAVRPRLAHQGRGHDHGRDAPRGPRPARARRAGRAVRAGIRRSGHGGHHRAAAAHPHVRPARRPADRGDPRRAGCGGAAATGLRGDAAVPAGVARRLQRRECVAAGRDRPPHLRRGAGRVRDAGGLRTARDDGNALPAGPRRARGARRRPECGAATPSRGS